MATKEETPYELPEKSLFYLKMELRDKGEAALSEEEIERLIAAGIMTRKKATSSSPFFTKEP